MACVLFLVFIVGNTLGVVKVDVFLSPSSTRSLNETDFWKFSGEFIVGRVLAGFDAEVR